VALFFLIHFRYCDNSYNINNKNCSNMLHVMENEKKKMMMMMMMMRRRRRRRILQRLLCWFLNLRDSHHFQTLFLKFSQPISCYKAQACNNNCRL
jgi:hypothetical protein